MTRARRSDHHIRVHWMEIDQAEEAAMRVSGMRNEESLTNARLV
jgi:hypothetical protein